MAIDLHLHSTASDGDLTPVALIEKCAGLSITKLALTDHDTIRGCADAQSACERLGIEFLSGIELSAMAGEKEVHLLGYGLRRFAGSRLESIIETEIQAFRPERFKEMAKRIESTGVRIDWEMIDAILATDAHCGRRNLALALVKMGAVEDVRSAFDQYLSTGQPGFLPNRFITAEDAIQLVHDAGGAAILAHPRLLYNDTLIPGLFRAGLDGLEARHPSHKDNHRRKYESFAAANGGISTGGSDYHSDSGLCQPGFPVTPDDLWAPLLARIARYET
jgi:hypothetical protein